MEVRAGAARAAPALPARQRSDLLERSPLEARRGRRVSDRRRSREGALRRNQITGYAVYRKVAQGAGESWYWYEKIGSRLSADGTGGSGKPKDVCVGCHAGAPNEFVFTQVR